MCQWRRPVRRLAPVLLLLALGSGVTAQTAENKAVAARLTEDEDFARSVKEWTTKPEFSSPLVDHLPKVAGVPVAEGRARLPHRRAEEADLLRRHPEVLPRARRRDRRA